MAAGDPPADAHGITAFRAVTLRIPAGTNFFMRARAAFEVSEYMEVQAYKDAEIAAEADAVARGDSATRDRVAPLNGDLLEDVPMIFAEDKISEDIDLGSRLHAAGFKASFVAERLATGEVRCAHCGPASASSPFPCCQLLPAPPHVSASLAVVQPPRQPSSERMHQAHASGLPPARPLHPACMQTPLDPRGMWRQRLRWFKGGHLFLFSKNSVFFQKDNHLTLYHKALYFFGPATHFVMFIFEPFITTLPFMCLVFRICPYGMDPILFWTHFAHIGISFFASVYDRSFDNILTGICAKGGIRILYFTAFKACINTIMVAFGYKKPGAFKVTRKAGDMAGGEDGRGEVDEQISISTADDSKVKQTASTASGAGGGSEEDLDDAAAVSGTGSATNNRPLANAGRVDSELSLRNSALDLPGLQRGQGTTNSPGRVTGGGRKKRGGGGEAAGGENVEDRGWDLTHVHASLSKVTNVRKKFMPLDGTLDIWVLVIRLFISLVAAGFGIYRIIDRDALTNWEERSTLIWLAVAFAIVDATPGLLYLGYAALPLQPPPVRGKTVARLLTTTCKHGEHACRYLFTYSWAPILLKVYSPLVLAVVVGGVTFIELRVVAGYVLGR